MYGIEILAHKVIGQGN